MPPLDLSGKRALVLGVETAAGRALALALAEAGADVAAVAARDDTESALAAKRLSAQIARLGRRSQAQAIDAALATAVQVTTRQVAKGFGGLDILVACPDYPQAGPTERLSEPEWARLVGLNLSALLFACRAAARELGRQGGGAVVIVTAAGKGAAYGALKAAAVELAVGLAQEYQGQSIRLNAIVYEGGEPPPALSEKALMLLAGEATGQVIRLGASSL